MGAYSREVKFVSLPVSGGPYPLFQAICVVSTWPYMLLRAEGYPQGHPPAQECGNLLEIEHGIRYNVTIDYVISLMYEYIRYLKNGI